MPSGEVHYKYWKRNRWAGIVLGIGLFSALSYVGGVVSFELWGIKHSLSHGLLVGLGATLGYMLGAVIDPDLDIMGTTKAEGRMMRIPWPVGAFLYSWWSFYGATFRRHHRSFWTHSYVVSTAIRWLWQFWPVLRKNPALDTLLIGVFLGLCLSDGIHIWLDKR